MNRTLLSLLCATMLLACSDDPAAEIPADIGGFELDAAAKKEIEEIQRDGRGAAGTFSWNEAGNKFVLELSRSDFRCGGPQAGEPLEPSLTLEAQRMLWEFDDGEVEWTRLDGGRSGVVGAWRATDEQDDTVLLLDAEGKATIFGREEEGCDKERNRNDEHCFELGLSGAEMAVDGELSDWQAVNDSATITDEQADFSGDDAGADIRAMKVEIEGEDLFVLMQLYGAPSQQFQGRQSPNGGGYRLNVQDTAGNRFFSRINYSPEQQRWEMIEPAEDSGVAFAVGPDGAEWRVSLDRFTEGPSLSIIRVEALDCGQQGQSCQILDEIDQCGYFPGFK